MDLILLYSTKFRKRCLPASSRYSKMKDSSLLICCVYWYTGTQVPEEMRVPVFEVVLGSRMQSSWDEIGIHLQCRGYPEGGYNKDTYEFTRRHIPKAWCRHQCCCDNVISDNYRTVTSSYLLSVPWSKHRRPFMDTDSLCLSETQCHCRAKGDSASSERTLESLPQILLSGWMYAF
jgi:hypothetical protein